MSHNLSPQPYLTFAQRRGLFIAQVAILSGYLISNRILGHLGGGVTFDIWLDQYIPLWPIWAIPYALALVWWGVALLWAYIKMEEPLYVAFATGWLSTCIIGYSFFLLYPNYVVRPEVTGAGWGAWAIHFIYANDRAYNAFPSQHLWTTVVIALFFSRWKPRLRWALWGFIPIVALSTLFTGQHWIMDIVGGAVLGVLGYGIGVALAARLKPIPRRHPSRASR